MANNAMAFTLNLKLIFTPLYGDKSIIGYLIGFIVRIVFITIGFFILIFLVITTVLLPLFWYLLPFAAIYYLEFWSIPSLILLYFLTTYLYSSTPSKKVLDNSLVNVEHSFKPTSLKITKQLKNNNIYGINALLSNSNIIAILEKSELDPDEIVPIFRKGLKNTDMKDLIQKAYSVAKEANTRYVELDAVFLAAISHIENIESILAAHRITFDMVKEAAFWKMVIAEEKSKVYFWQPDYELPPMGGFGHGLTGVVTPNLDTISRDLTKEVKMGLLEPIVGRKEEIKKISEHLGGSTNSILLIGAPGSGKTSLARGIAHEIIHGTKNKTISNKRLVNLDLGQLLAGLRNSGDLADKINKAMNEITRSKDIILFMDEVHSLVASVEGNSDFSTIYAILEPHMSSSNVRIIGATSPENYKKYMEPIQSFTRLFETIEIPESNFRDTINILEFVSTKFEKEFNILITTPALYKIVNLSEKLIHDRVFPDKAIDILKRAANEASSSTKLLNSKIVEKVITEYTHVPVQEITGDQSKKLLELSDKMKQKVIGQDHAIDKIAAAMKRAAVGIRDENKPIASFLFVGSTGVGKTETAKTLSSVYFGNPKAMIRLDMSEYQNQDSIDKLIGTSDGRNKGILTETVRSTPFTLILLDEIEKAHPNVLLTFLQVLDDGRLTDSYGRTTDFTNTIIIATSNVGTKQIQEITYSGGSFETIEKETLKEVRNHFAPEFLNRFTGIIVYKSLTKPDVRKITLLLLNKVRAIAENKGIKLTFKEDLIETLISEGYNPEWGARPMARLIEEKVETFIAEGIISNNIKKGDHIQLGREIFN